MRRQFTTASLLLLAAPLVAACSGVSGLLPDKDAEWFSRPARIFTPRSVSLDTGPLNPSGPVGPNDLVSADGACAGMSAADANASVQAGGSYSLGSTECDLVRVAGSPDNISVNGSDANRDVTLTYLKGSRPGIYHFSGGRLTSVEQAPVPAAPAKQPAKRTTKRTT